MFKIMIFLIINIISSSYLGAAPEVDIKKYIDSDFLTEEVQLKENAQKQKLKTLYIKKKKQFQYPSFDDFWQFSFEYWIVKNVQLLKWNRSLDSDSLKDEIQKLSKNIELNLNDFKVFIVPTSWIPHFALPKGKGRAFFFISQQFIREANLNEKEAAIIILMDYFRLRSGHMLKFLQNEKIAKKLGGSFYLEKKPDLASFDQLMKRINYFLREYGYQFSQEFNLIEQVKKQFSANQKFLNLIEATYKKIYQSKSRVQRVFPRYEGIYPAFEFTHLWLRK